MAEESELKTNKFNWVVMEGPKQYQLDAIRSLSRLKASMQNSVFISIKISDCPLTYIQKEVIEGFIKIGDIYLSEEEMKTAQGLQKFLAERHRISQRKSELHCLVIEDE